jgi:hypothetical protein
MADLASSAVSVVRAWTEGGVAGKDRVGSLLTLTLTGQGSTTNKITASALGYSKVESCGNLLDCTNTKVYPAVPSSDGSAVYTMNPCQATDANRADPADLTCTGRIEVHGYR